MASRTDQSSQTGQTETTTVRQVAQEDRRFLSYINEDYGYGAQGMREHYLLTPPEGFDFDTYNYYWNAPVDEVGSGRYVQGEELTVVIDELLVDAILTDTGMSDEELDTSGIDLLETDQYGFPLDPENFRLVRLGTLRSINSHQRTLKEFNEQVASLGLKVPNWTEQ